MRKKVRVPDLRALRLLGARFFLRRIMMEQDWHPADVTAALKKRGHSLSGLSIGLGYHPTAAGKALKKPWPAMEKVIADALGVTPKEIWPSRYTGGERPLRQHERHAPYHVNP